MKHRNSHLMVGYWSRLRKGRNVPDQTDVDPRQIKRMLASIFILDAGDPARPIYRLAGTALCDRFGFELKSTSFLAHWEAQSRGALVTSLRQSLSSRQPICISSIASTADCGMAELETTLAPVSFGDGGPTRFIGIMHVLSDPAPLAGRPIAFQRLVSCQIVAEEEPLSTFTPPPPTLPPIEPIRSHPRAPHLRLVVSRQKPQTFYMETGLQDLIAMLGINGPALA